MTQDNSAYEKAYGAWAGFPNGRAPDFKFCCVEVWSKERSAHGHQCRRPRGFGPGEAYCKQHDPAAEAERRRVSDEKLKIEVNKRRTQGYGQRFHDALKQIADGHNDPRTFATETLAEFDKGAR